MLCPVLVEIAELGDCPCQRCALSTVRRGLANLEFSASVGRQFGLETRGETERGDTSWERCAPGAHRAGPS